MVDETGTSAARIYWESVEPLRGGRQAAPEVRSGRVHRLPGEIFQAPRKWPRRSIRTSSISTKSRRAPLRAWEEPQLFAEEIAPAFASVARRTH
jgi:hypothetical protein